MLGTGASLNSGELGVTLVKEHIATSPEISNIPLSPEVQSRLPLRSDLERDGYDSDASVNPYAEVADEGPLKVNEPPLQEAGNGDIPLGVVQEDTESGHFIDIPPAKLAQMKVSELKYELSRRGQPVGGRKVVLLERLKMALFQQIAIKSTNNHPQQTMDNLNDFSPSAKWRPLVAMEEAMEEPDNAAPLMHAPTIPVEHAEFIPQKHNFAERFDRECFVGREKVPKFIQHNNTRTYPQQNNNNNNTTTTTLQQQQDNNNDNMMTTTTTTQEPQQHDTTITNETTTITQRHNDNHTTKTLQNNNETTTINNNETTAINNNNTTITQPHKQQQHNHTNNNETTQYHNDNHNTTTTTISQ